MHDNYQLFELIMHHNFAQIVQSKEASRALHNHEAWGEPEIASASQVLRVQRPEIQLEKEKFREIVNNYHC